MPYLKIIKHFQHMESEQAQYKFCEGVSFKELQRTSATTQSAAVKIWTIHSHVSLDCYQLVSFITARWMITKPKWMFYPGLERA